MSTSFTFRADADLSTVIRTVAATRCEPVSVLIRKAIRSTVVDEITASESIRRGLAAYDPVKRAIGPVADRRWRSERPLARD